MKAAKSRRSGCLKQLGLKDEDTPFPWQLTILDEFPSDKLRPALRLLKGLGKPSDMAIWLVARALRAPVPRRTLQESECDGTRMIVHPFDPSLLFGFRTTPLPFRPRGEVHATRTGKSG